MAPKLLSKIRIETPLLREILAEFLGTFVLVVRLIHCHYGVGYRYASKPMSKH